MKNKLFLLTLATSLVIATASCGKEATVEETRQQVIETTVEESTNIVKEDADVEEPTSEVKDVNVAKVEETEATTTEVEEVVTEAEEVTTTEEIDYMSEDYEGTFASAEDNIVYPDGFVVEEGDYVVQPGEWEALTEQNRDYIKGCYKFLTIHYPEYPSPEEACVETQCTLYMRHETDEILALVNEDFSKAYDIIEECGITVTTDTWGEMAANEVRMEVTDYDTFFEALGKITEFTAGIARARGYYSNGIDAINAGEVTEYAEAMSYLDGYDLYTSYMDNIDASTDYYNQLIKYLH